MMMEDDLLRADAAKQLADDLLEDVPLRGVDRGELEQVARRTAALLDGAEVEVEETVHEVKEKGFAATAEKNRVVYVRCGEERVKMDPRGATIETPYRTRDSPRGIFSERRRETSD